MILKQPAQLLIAVAVLALASPFAAQADEVSDGEVVFAAKCAVCHNTDSAGDKGLRVKPMIFTLNFVC